MKWVIVRLAGLVLLLTGVTVLLPGRGAEAWNTPPPNCFDFVTGGGWFAPTPLGSDKANFGFEAGYKNGPPPPPLMGEMNYIDHNNGMHVHATSVTAYGGFNCTDANGNACADRFFSGDATVNGVPGFTYSVEVIDDGEPGNTPKGHDRFRISVSNGYQADSGGAPDVGPSDGIDGGNIQIHKDCTGVNPK